jgi:DNA-binding transcriptional LysR family regulator
MEMIEIQAFVTIARTGSFTAAAGELGISQPAVSRRVELLEAELGQPLFDRIHSGARLTAAGEAFLPHARHVLSAVRDGMAAVEALASGSQGSISLALVGTLASTSLTVKLRAFRETYPDIHLQLRTARSFEVSALVQQGDVMLGLRYFADPATSVESIKVADEALVVACAAGSELATRYSINPANLRGTPWIGFPTGSHSSGEPFARVLQHTLSRANLDDAEIIEIDSLTAQKRLIEAGFGIGLLPESSIEEELRLGTLAVLETVDLRASVPVMAIYRRKGFLSPAARTLLDMLGMDEGDNT